jgi:hypothetical protein
MQIRCGGIEPGLDPQRPPDTQPGPEVFLRQDLYGATPDLLERGFDGHYAAHGSD